MKRVSFLFVIVFSCVAIAADFELPGTLKASELLEAEQIRGAAYEIENTVSSDGYSFTYSIKSKFGIFDAEGKSLLAIRLREIEAIAKLKEVTGSEAFAKAVGAAAVKPIESTVNLVQNPSETAKGIPGGVKRKFENLGRFVKRGAKEVSEEEEIDPGSEQQNTESTAASVSKTVMGVTAAHRKWAQTVGVDPYSSNAPLQQELDRLAKYDAAGKFTTNIVRPKIDQIETAAKVNDLVWGKDPLELRKLNEKRLQEMGVDKELSGKFLDHKPLTPSHQTRIISSLYVMEQAKGRAELIRASLTAQSEDEALFYCDSAAILEKMHQSGNKITAFVPAARIALVRAGKRIVAVLPADRLFWTKSLVAALETFLKRHHSELQSASTKELWLSGDTTQRTRSELKSRGWIIHENSLQ